jgi:hypothetical protein
VRSEQAAEAVRLAPWRADYRRDYAADLWDGGSTEVARQQLAVALRYAPADARLWLQYELQLATDAPQDPLLLQAIARVDQLAPAEPELQLAQADLAVQSWHRVGPPVRQAWLPSLRYVLAQDRDAFLVRSFRQGGESNLCLAAPELKLEQWCSYAAAARMFCSRGELNPAQAQQCLQWGILPGAAPGARP